MQLSIENLYFSYSGRDVLRGCDLQYESPSCLCILGTNGAGKSTLLRCLMRELKVREGRIRIDGRALETYSSRELACKFAYIPQSHQTTFPFRVLDLVTMGRTAHWSYFANPSKEDYVRAQEALAYLKIEFLQEKLFTELSGGERQLVLLAAALAQEAEVLLLDEPTAHLDFGHAARFLDLMDQLREAGKGICMTTHFPDHALYLNSETALLKEGQLLIQGGAEDVLVSDVLSELYGLPVSVHEVGDSRVCLAHPRNRSNGKNA